MTRDPRIPACIAIALALAAPARANDPAIQQTTALLEGQAITGPFGPIGAVTSVDNVAVNDLGATLIECDTNNANTDVDSVLLLAGSFLVQEGTVLPAPAGASLDSFDAVTLNNAGNSGWNFFLAGTAGGNDDSGIYINSSLVIQEGNLATASGLSPGTPYIGFFETKINSSNQILVMASVDDPAVASTVDRALVVVDPITTLQTLVLKEGDLAPGLGGPFVADFNTGPHDFDFDDSGHVLFFCDTDDPDTGKDGAIYLDTAPLAREGSPSPFAGRNWSGLSSAKLSLNNQGDHVYSGSLDGDAASNAVIVKNGAKFMQEGDVLPAIAPFKLTAFGSGPILLADRGTPDEDADVLWFGDWDDPDTNVDTGLFLDDQLILREGVDTVGGIVIEDVRGIQDGYAMSDDGRYVLVEVNLVGNLDAAVLLDRGPWKNLGKAKPGTSKPKLRAHGSLAAGDPVTLRLSRAQPGAVATLIVGLGQIDLPFFGGTLVPSPQVIVTGLPVDANGILSVTAPLPVGVPSGVQLVLQYWVTDPGATFGYASSNGVVGTAP